MDYTKAIETLTNTNNLLTVLFVLIAAAVLFVLCGSVVKTWRDFRNTKNGGCTALKEKLDRHEERLNAHDDEITDLHEGMRVQCQAIKALLNHAIHDGNTTEMEKAAAELDKWLINR